MYASRHNNLNQAVCSFLFFSQTFTPLMRPDFELQKTQVLQELDIWNPAAARDCFQRWRSNSRKGVLFVFPHIQQSRTISTTPYSQQRHNKHESLNNFLKC
jgi:hypothetical protein